MASLICGISKEMIQMNLQNRNRNRLTDLEKELMVVGKRGKVEGRMGEGIVREFVHIAIF